MVLVWLKGQDLWPTSNQLAKFLKLGVLSLQSTEAALVWSSVGEYMTEVRFNGVGQHESGIMDSKI